MRVTAAGARAFVFQSRLKTGQSLRLTIGEPLGKTIPGPLHALLSRPLALIDPEAIDAWVSSETRNRPARARLGFRLLQGFINWCAEHVEYRHLASKDSHKGKRTREKLGKAKTKADVIQREQLASWFDAVRKDQNQVASAYLQCLLLTGTLRRKTVV